MKTYSQESIKTAMLGLLEDAGCLLPKQKESLQHKILSMQELAHLVKTALKENRERKEFLEERCKSLQARLDSIHQSTLFDMKPTKRYGPNLKEEYARWLRKKGFTRR